MSGWDLLYPRPIMVRGNYMILGKGWKLNGQTITVPFPPESKASGYRLKRNFRELMKSDLVYEVNFQLNKDLICDKAGRENVLLHFGAVDQMCQVYLNEKYIGSHKGGYDNFTFNITRFLDPSGNSLKVVVRDRLNKQYPYGKQRRRPGGMWYTPVSGIWQQVWLEKVPEDGFYGIETSTTMEKLEMTVHTTASRFQYTIFDADGNKIYTDIWSGSEEHLQAEEGNKTEPKFVINFKEKKIPVHNWSPESPYLYGIVLKSYCDKAESYFGLREISIENISGRERIYLNKKPLFLHGVLDQGYFSDGIFLPAEPDGYEKDIRRMKELGFNTLRKHIKAEPEVFYYQCDRLGMLVMQDMINSGGYNFIFDTALPSLGMWRRRDDWPWGKKRKKIFVQSCKRLILRVRNHPSVVSYTIFNEGWGQFEADNMYRFIKGIEGDKIIDSTSGWFAQTLSDLDSYHIYFRNEVLKPQKRPLFLSECGGYSRRIKGHEYNSRIKYGYGEVFSEKELTDKILQMYEEMVIPVISKGMCGCIFTQLSDVECENNGLYTYDRQICKVTVDKLKKISRKIYKEREKCN